jgi:hypothetical protein
MRLLSHAIQDYGVACIEVFGILRWSATLAVFSPFHEAEFTSAASATLRREICAYAPPFLKTWASGSTADAPGL